MEVKSVLARTIDSNAGDLDVGAEGSLESSWAYKTNGSAAHNSSPLSSASYQIPIALSSHLIAFIITHHIMISSALIASVLAASPVLGLVRSPKPTFVDNSYVINEDARFAYNLFFNFTGATKLPDGLYTSVYTVGEGTHQYTTSNVNVAGGYLQLKVPGGQKSMPYSGGEVATTEERILYASVRTVAILSEPAGVCNGMYPLSKNSR